MRIVVCVKWVPVLNAMRFDPATRRRNASIPSTTHQELVSSSTTLIAP